MPRRKIAELGLDLDRLRGELLEKLATELEEYIRREVSRLFPADKAYDLDIVVGLENKGDRIDVYIEVAMSSSFQLEESLDSLLKRVVNDARRYIEKRLTEESMAAAGRGGEGETRSSSDA